MNENLCEKEKALRHQIIETGLKLLDTGLVARTWGNVSAKLDSSKIIITPSGLDYRGLNDDDLPVYDCKDGEWTGPYKPSGEKLVHKAAYENIPDASFVIHTHQTYATAIGLTGFDTLDITDDEREKLGGIALAGYGLSGTKKLEKAVAKAMENGAHTIFMVHHGVLIAGKDMDDTIQRALLLEEICKRNCKAKEDFAVSDKVLAKGVKLKSMLKKQYEYCDILQTPAAVALSEYKSDMIAQIDDMAQMEGRKAPFAGDSSDDESMLKLVADKLNKHDAVIVSGAGIIVKAENSGDLEALMILMHKAAVTWLHTKASGKNVQLGALETALMHFIYKKKYSKQSK